MSSNLVSTQWLQDRLDQPNLVILDGSWYLPTMNRDPEAEYAAAHIPGARRFDIDAVRDTTSALPHMLPAPDDFGAAADALGIDDDKIVVVYDGAGLFAAARVWWTFKTFGAPNVFVLDGGFPKWQAEGRPVTTEVPAPILERPPIAKRFIPRYRPSAVVDAPAVLAMLENPDAQIVDARPADRFRGEAPEPRPGLRAGHIPGSRNLPFPQVIDNGRIAAPEKVRAAFAAAGVDLSKPIVTSCGSGVSAAILALALAESGVAIAALYDGSWADWGGRADLPIATG